MDATTKLRSLIFDRYKSVKEFSEAANVPYTTVHSILQRGVENSSVGNVIKLCRALEISVDDLLKPEDTYYVNPDTAQIAEKAFSSDRLLMSANKNLSPESAKAITDMVNLLIKIENPHLEDWPDEEFPDDHNQDTWDE